MQRQKSKKSEREMQKSSKRNELYSKLSDHDTQKQKNEKKIP